MSVNSIDRSAFIARYDSYIQLILTLAKQLDNVEFDCVLAVIRGGYMPGEIVSRIFSRPLIVTRLSSYRKGVRGKVQDLGTIGTPFGKILIVDDLADSGESLRYLKSKYPGAITAVLWNKDKPRDVNPDYYAVRVSDTWITQPMDMFNRLHKSAGG